jgi:hypothetical protein
MGFALITRSLRIALTSLSCSSLLLCSSSLLLDSSLACESTGQIQGLCGMLQHVPHHVTVARKQQTEWAAMEQKRLPVQTNKRAIVTCFWAIFMSKACLCCVRLSEANSMFVVSVRGLLLRRGVKTACLSVTALGTLAARKEAKRLFSSSAARLVCSSNCAAKHRSVSKASTHMVCPFYHVQSNVLDPTLSHLPRGAQVCPIYHVQSNMLDPTLPHLPSGA